LIETRIDGSSKNFINLHPTPIDLGRAYLDLINEWNWQGFTILYEDSPWLPLVDYIMINYKKKFPIFVRQLHVTADGNYRMRLNQVKRFDAENIVICSSTEKLPEILKQAQQVGLLSEGRRVLITSLDMHTVDLEPYQYAGCTIAGFRLLNTDDPDFIATTKDIYEYAERNPKFLRSMTQQQSSSSYYTEDPNQNDPIPEGLTTEGMIVSTALTHDAGNF
jgi:ionotropic kainate glutamate receptor 2